MKRYIYFLSITVIYIISLMPLITFGYSSKTTLDTPSFDSRTIRICGDDVLLTGRNDGYVVIKNAGECKTSSITMNNITGAGTIEIENTGKRGIYVKEVSQQNIAVTGDNFKIINFSENGTSIDNIRIQVTGNSNGLLYVGSGVRSKLLEVSSIGRMQHMKIDGNMLETIKIKGLTIGDIGKSLIEILEVHHAHAAILGQSEYQSSGVYLNNLAVGRLLVTLTGQTLSEGNDQGLLAHNLNIGRGGLEIDIDGEHQFMELRNIVFQDNTKSNLHIKTRGGSSLARLVLSNVFVTNTVLLEPLGVVKDITLKQIISDYIQIDMRPEHITKLNQVEISKIEPKWSIQSPPDVLLLLAKKNSTAVATDRADYYTLVAKKGTYLNEEGEYRSPRLEALKGRYLEDLSQRDIAGKIIGYILYGATGYGSSFLPPFLFWMITITVFGTIYWLFPLRSQPIAFKQAYYYSLLFSLSMGFPSSKGIAEKFSLPPLKEERRRKDSILFILPHVQGAIVAAQLTFLTIYFGQTIITPL